MTTIYITDFYDKPEMLTGVEFSTINDEKMIEVSVLTDGLHSTSIVIHPAQIIDLRDWLNDLPCVKEYERLLDDAKDGNLIK